MPNRILRLVALAVIAVGGGYLLTTPPVSAQALKTCSCTSCSGATCTGKFCQTNGCNCEYL
jgi:hypothetical protein